MFNYKEQLWIILISSFISLLLLGGCSKGGPTGSDEENDESVDKKVSASFESDDTLFLPGEVQRILIDGITLNSDEYTAEITNEQRVTLYRDSSYTEKEALLFVVPEISSQNHKLQLSLSGQAQELTFSVESYEEIEDPYSYTTTMIESIESDLQIAIDGANDNVARDTLQSVMEELVSRKEELSSFSNEEMKMLARFLKTYLEGEVGTTSKQRKNGINNVLNTAGETCEEFSQQFMGSLEDVFLSTAAISAGIIVLPTGIGTFVGTVAIGVGVARLVTALRVTVRTLANYYDQCMSFNNEGVDSYLTELPSGEVANKFNYKMSASSSSNTEFSFQHDIPRSFLIMSKFELPEELKQPLQELRAEIKDLMNKVPESWIRLIFRDYEAEQQDDPSNFGVQNISDERINGMTGVNENEITITFSYEEEQMPDTKQSFTFELYDVNNTEQITVIDATLKPGYSIAPTASDIRVNLKQDESVTDTLKADRATSFSILSQPDNGNISLNQSTGVFVYQPNSGFAGDDSFTFQAINNVGNSEVATAWISVNIPLPDDCEVKGYDENNLPSVITCQAYSSEAGYEVIYYQESFVGSYHIVWRDLTTGRTEKEVNIPVHNDTDVSFSTYNVNVEESGWRLDQRIRTLYWESYWGDGVATYYTKITERSTDENGEYILFEKLQTAEAYQSDNPCGQEITKAYKSGNSIQISFELLPNSSCYTPEEVFVKIGELFNGFQLESDSYLYRLRN